MAMLALSNSRVLFSPWPSENPSILLKPMIPASKSLTYIVLVLICSIVVFNWIQRKTACSEFYEGSSGLNCLSRPAKRHSALLWMAMEIYFVGYLPSAPCAVIDNPSQSWNQVMVVTYCYPLEDTCCCPFHLSSNLICFPESSWICDHDFVSHQSVRPMFLIHCRLWSKFPFSMDRAIHHKSSFLCPCFQDVRWNLDSTVSFVVWSNLFSDTWKKELEVNPIHGTMVPSHQRAREHLGSFYEQGCIELNASDERGIDVVREKIKVQHFSRSSHESPAGRHESWS